MSVYGNYDAQHDGNTSSLFIYKETPVASSKLNRWNGNIEAGFDLLHAVCSALFTRGEPAVIATNDVDALNVVEAGSPDMTVRVKSGWAIFESGFAGLKAESALPSQGVFIAPSSNPRIDLIALSITGELVVVEGDEAAAPDAPSAPSGAIGMARIYHRPGSTKILNNDNLVDSYLIDARPRFVHSDAHRHSTDAAPTESPDDVRTEFSTQDYFRSGSLRVFLNGVLQKHGADYTEEVGGQSYQFATAPAANSTITHHYLIDRLSDN